MGGASSTPSDGTSPQIARDLRLLLGNFDRLDPMTQRLVSLGKKCLTSTILDSQQNNFKRLEEFNAEASGAPLQVPLGGAEAGAEAAGSTAKGSDNFSPVDFESYPFEDTVGDSKSLSELKTEDSHDLHLEGSSARGMEQDEDAGLFLPLTQARPIYLGQTYPRWKYMYKLQNMYALCVPTRKIIYIQPIDEFPDFMTEFRISMKSLSLDVFSLLQGFTQIFFSGLDVTVLPSVSMERMGWTNLVKTRCHKETEQKQYRAKDFYPLLKSSLPSDGHCVLGLVWTDLYPEDDLNFTLGEVSFYHRAGIFCFGRFETKGFNKETHKDITEVDGFLVWKLIRAISHELCHLFGLRHCTYFHCSMNESTSLVEAMDQPLFLCPVCLRKLHEVCRFDVLDRYQQMLGFLLELQTQLPSVHCDKAIVWLQNCISFLQQPASATGN
ncbi:archaemetzincin-2-like [Haliotis rufescens]|uniref:archaemetzincin-2-like n=1 Tax=Haliotis rufescens TaxID=6454 RepID=UPI001EAF9331|nr:archaemetzincin-2-like [Haliotis rufescens]XP_046328235.1 archaemetzincin-2-like [Haliotis rufescens]XP_046328236.1 archaemetzincin-2-like [Haliotis rufescens]